MANSKSRLGRGLGGLISGVSDVAGKKPVFTTQKETDSKAAPSVAVPTSEYLEISIKDLEISPYQPRRKINEWDIEDLARSIQSEGLLQPILVRAKGNKFELIAGERRLRAFEFLKEKKIPARVIEANDVSSATLALIENLQRENLNPIDEALGYASLVRDFDLTQAAIAKRVGKGRASVANALRLLTLEVEIQEFLSRQLISTGHAKALLGLENEEQRKLLAKRIVETGMSVRDAEQFVSRLKTRGEASQGAIKKPEDTFLGELRDLEKRIGEYLNTRCTLRQGAKKGKLTIEYMSDEDLERILEKLGIAQR